MAIQEKHFIQDETGNWIEIYLPIDEYPSILERLEDLEDLASYHEAKAEPSKPIPIPLDEFVRELDNLNSADESALHYD